MANPGLLARIRGYLLHEPVGILILAAITIILAKIILSILGLG